MRLILLPVAAVLFLAGCATVTERQSQLVEIVTPGVEQAYCDLRTPKQHYRLVAPGSTRVEKSRHDLTITCTKENYLTAVVALKPERHTERSVGGNLYNAVLPGYVTDMVTGAIYSYPERVEIAMKPLNLVAGQKNVSSPVGAAATNVEMMFVYPVEDTGAPVENVEPAPASPMPASTSVMDQKVIDEAVQKKMK